jgi:WD40 repeat protein
MRRRRESNLLGKVPTARWTEPAVPVPLTKQGAREPVLQAVCSCTEGAAVVVPKGAPALAAALQDRARFSVLGGREGLRRSVGSVFAARVVLFLGPSFERTLQPLFGHYHSSADSVLCFYDTSRVLTTSTGRTINVLRAADSAFLHSISGGGRRPLEFNDIRQVCTSSDGFVFVADGRNNRVVVLTPQLGFHGVIGVHVLDRPEGVCVGDDVVVVSEELRHCITVFRRRDGALLRRFGSARGRVASSKLRSPGQLCFMTASRCVAVANRGHYRVSVFTAEGVFIRHIGGNFIVRSIVCSAFDELVVASTSEVYVYDRSGTACRVIKGLHWPGAAVRNDGILIFWSSQMSFYLCRYT